MDARPLYQHAGRDLGGSPRRWRYHVGPVPKNSPPARASADRVAWDPHVHLDMEPVSPRAGACRGPIAENDGWCVGSVPGPLRNQCPTVMRWYDHHSDSYPPRVCAVPAPDYQGSTPRRGQGMISEYCFPNLSTQSY